MASFDINITGDDVLKHFSNENGIGAESAITLASAYPKEIILVVRTESKVISVIEAIRKINPDIEVSFVEIDLLNNKSVRQAVEKIKNLTDKIHVLINNAGVIAVKHFVTLLAKEIIAAASEGARIVQVGILGYQLGETNIEDINFKDGKIYNPRIAYGQAKTAMLLFNLALDKRLKQKGVTALICHPGVTLESMLLVNSNVDNESFADALVLVMERNDANCISGNPLLPQNMVILKQAAGVCAPTNLWKLTEAAPAFIVGNETYTETKDHALNQEIAKGLWKLSEKPVGETFVY
ncbi:uncharacterized protein EAF01_001632 [Botrytis porri]|uniref:uncharacterized protein n=1 Tax=Botrytis porri TaxID=87229 RepID=UPI0019014F6A|nr:uncharacterized protein EAF01_001632 [Botrytis porri]KAF7912611.1 hypothetical protein EAF01_001632 [Botrytis porri]